MLNGYMKDVTSASARHAEITFTAKGDSATYRLEDVLELTKSMQSSRRWHFRPATVHSNVTILELARTRLSDLAARTAST